MELSFIQGRQFQVDSTSKYSSSVNSQSQINKKSTKKIMSLGSSIIGASSRKRIRRQNSIQESITNYFKDNKLKVASFLNINQEVIHLIHPSNLIFPQHFKILEDGLYILIRGGVKMITFNDQQPPYRSICREITNNAFRMMKNNKDLAIKSLENGSILFGKQLQKKNYYRNRGKNEIQHNIYTITKTLSVFECINENCLSFCPQTILYKIQEQDAKQFCFKEKKQEVHDLIKKNNHLIVQHSMLHHTIELKVCNFRSVVKFENVAIIKTGSVKVTKREKFKSEFSKQPIQFQKIICQLSEGSLLIPQLNYQVSSCYAQILAIDFNDSFKLLKLPQWAQSFLKQEKKQKKEQVYNIKYKAKTKKNSLNITQNQEQIFKNKKPLVKKIKQQKVNYLKENDSSLQRTFQATSTNKKSLTPSLLNPFLTSSVSSFHFLKQNFLDYLPNNQKLRKVKFKFENQKKAEASNSLKLAYQIVDKQNVSSNSGHCNGQINNKKTKQKLFFKAMSPYIIISQKIGIKQMIQTQKILKKKSYSIQQIQKKKTAKLQKLKSIQNKRTFYTNQRKSWKNKSLYKMTRYLSKENQHQFQKESKENQKKLTQSHKKSYSQMSTYYGDSVLNKCRQRGIYKELSKLDFHRK